MMNRIRVAVMNRPKARTGSCQSSSLNIPINIQAIHTWEKSSTKVLISKVNYPKLSFLGSDCLSPWTNNHLSIDGSRSRPHPTGPNSFVFARFRLQFCRKSQASDVGVPPTGNPWAPSICLYFLEFDHAWCKSLDGYIFHLKRSSIKSLTERKVALVIK